MLASWSGYLSPSPSTDSSSTRSSHLSVLTSSSSITSASAPSPLPSPSVSVHSIGRKTNAFFGSPFSGSSMPLPPPNPNKCTGSVKSRASIDSLMSQVSATSSSENGSSAAADETPRIEQRAPKRSLNADFFGPSHLPTPPPTAARFPSSPTDSRESSNSPPTRLPPLPSIPLSRLFPSRRRYGTEDDTQSDSSPGHRRDFVQLEPIAPPDVHQAAPAYAEAYTASPAVENLAIPAPAPSDMPTPTPDSEPKRRSFFHVPPEPKPASSSESDLPLIASESGQVLKSASLSLRLVRVLGQGAFSSVWLANDIDDQLSSFELSRKNSLLKSKSLKRGRSRRVDGLRPKLTSHASSKTYGGVPMRRETGVGVHGQEQSNESIYLDEEGMSKVQWPSKKVGRLVAVKTTEREVCDNNSRSRVSFVREVEILRHISHPSIISYVHSFSTPSYHCLVLAYVSGGELFDVIDNAESHSHLDEPLLRRIFGELCKAVGWMHGVGLVHRDIKLENILLTTSIFSNSLPSPPASLIKLSDFGLSRFIDPANPQLTTLCGSESYAAPELVTGRPYDGRETDAWACGVVLYALATRRLPFDRQRTREQDETNQPSAPNKADLRAERRALLMRIAKAEFSWPEDALTADGSTSLAGDNEAQPLKGTGLVRSIGVRRIVERLLVRDPRKRSKIIDLWEDEWMRGEGAPLAPSQFPADGDAAPANIDYKSESGDATSQPDANARSDIDADADMDADADDDDGLIVDGDDIGPGSVARQEH